MRGGDWTIIKDKWIQRQLAGERVTWAELGRDHGLNPETVRAAARRYGWKAELEARQGDLARAAFEQLRIDHLAERRRLLGLRNRLEGIAWKLADRYERRLDQPGWEPGARDLASIVTLIEKLTVAGAGLPKQHPVEVDGHQEVVANRAQMKALERRALFQGVYDTGTPGHLPRSPPRRSGRTPGTRWPPPPPAPPPRPRSGGRGSARWRSARPPPRSGR